MHWIFVGVMIWIGLAIAPAVLGLVALLLPGIFFGAIFAVIGVLITGDFVGFFWGGLIGAILPYIVMNWSPSS
jgi:hypothetical protein